ncbi:hypothetical protein BMI91_19550 [Thioclava sediminum]|uniref:Uncharacterized protein n=1 Tax=Thioclava sediminum TaxID=1915319 RepID=A0ABX3MT18_9RHOB|nr:hypothetical protein BMI91_19550 [Thioclava sediminum]
MSRHGLDASKLDDFSPRKREPRERRAGGSTESEGWASRETAPAQVSQKPQEGQFNIRAPVATIERFKTLCKSDRRTYADMLEILMNEFERR